MAVRRIAAHFALLPDGLVRNAVVTAGEDGSILDVTVTEHPDREYGVEFYSGILIPGMVNAHCHLELSHMHGTIPEGCGFTGFAGAMGSAKRDTPEEERLASASYRDARMWSEGVAAVGDVSNTTLTFPVKRDSRIKYHTFMEVYGLATLSAAHALRSAKEGVSSGLWVSVTPHSMYSLNEGLLEETVSADDGTLSVHFMESPDESELFAGRGPMHDWYNQRGFAEDFTGVYGSPAERLTARIPGSRKILLVHNTFVTRADVERVNDHFGDNVTWVVCPASNKYITGTLPPVDMLRSAGCRIAVGTDSLASNHALSMVEEMKLLGGKSLEETLFWATCNGAEALGICDMWGSIEQGKTPGIVLLENLDMDGIRLRPESVTRRLL